MNLEDSGHDRSLPIVLALARVTYVDRMLTAVHEQDRSVPVKQITFRFFAMTCCVHLLWKTGIFAIFL
jgi:hypothetical protein